MVDDELLLVVAKALQWTHSKATAGQPRKWGQLSDEEQRLWIRMARQAASKLAMHPESESPAEQAIPLDPPAHSAEPPTKIAKRPSDVGVGTGQSKAATASRSDGQPPAKGHEATKPGQPAPTSTKADGSSRPDQLADSASPMTQSTSRSTGSSWTDLLRRKRRS
jgi:hypothetical protein